MVTPVAPQEVITSNSELHLPVPHEFSFTNCLKFLNRNRDECLHRIDGENWEKLITLAGVPVIIRLTISNNYLKVILLNTSLSAIQQRELTGYIREVFDLNRDLKPFYDHVKQDPVMGKISQDFYGLRLLGIPDLFEALCWCIIGQQINLTFAYKLKKRLVEALGEAVSFNGVNYYLFPTPGAVAGLSEQDFSGWQYSKSKAAYIVGVAREINKGSISRDMLLAMTPAEAQQKLMSLKGIGPWSAQYVMMKCLRINTAFPQDDVGLQNAISNQLGADTKPSTGELASLGKRWNPWQAYATFYLWHSLIK